MSFENQEIKSFKPGNIVEGKKRHLPDAPGFNKIGLWKINKPSKRRVAASKKDIAEIN